MNIHEYQAKNLFRNYGISVLNGGIAFTIEEATKVAKKINSQKWIIKAQIHAGGRGKGGGIKIANSLEEVKAHASSILGMNLVTPQTGTEGKKVLKIYIEEACEILKEFYLGIVLDRSKGRFVMMLSTEGGMDIEKVAAEKPEKIITTKIDLKDGPDNNEIEKIINIFNFNEKQKNEAKKLIISLYKILIEKDASLIEINPLVITKNNQIICLDAKMNFDDNAIFRRPDILDLRDLNEEDPAEIEASKYDLAYIKLNGSIGCMVNGAGLAMATMDIIKLHGKEPANFLDVGGGASKEKVTAAFKLILADKNVKGILINIFGGIMRCDVLAQGVVEAAKQVNLSVPLVVRLAGTNFKEGKKILDNSNLKILSASDLNDAAKKIVEAIK